MSRKESGCGSLLLAACAVIGLVMFVNHLADGGSSKRPPPDPWLVTGSQGGARFVVIKRDHARDQAAYERAAREVCGREWCQVSFWVEGDSASTSLPLSPTQANARAAAYLQNPANGVRRWAWDCATYFPAGSPCLARD